MAGSVQISPDDENDHPSPSHNNDFPTVVSIHFPGVLRNTANSTNAIAALGGEDAVRAHVTAVATLSRSEYVKVPPLSLSLRPGDATSTSNIEAGEPRPMLRTFALRVHRPTEITNTSDSSSQVQILGMVEHTVPFPGIADWAYVGDRTLKATADAISKPKQDNISFDYSNAPDRVPTGPRKRRRTASWRPKFQNEMRTQRAVDIAEFVRKNLCAPPPRPKPNTSGVASRDASNDNNVDDANTEPTESNRGADAENGAKNSDTENGQKQVTTSQEGAAMNVVNIPLIKQANENNAEGATNLTTGRNSTTERGKRNAVDFENQLQVMELCRPWRFSRTGIELAQTDYFFQQQSYQRESLLHSAFQLGQDRRSDATRLMNKPWKVAANGDKVPSCPPSPSALRVHSNGKPLPQRRMQNRELLFNDLKRLFDERPVWVRRNVCQLVKFELHGSFVHTARRVGYSFYGPGPFMQAWIRYGYDPRKDRGARGFQVVDLRLNNPVVVEAIKVQYAKMKAPLSPKMRPTAFKPDYTLAEVPTLRHLFLQLCDIEIPAVQRLIAEEKYPKKYSPKIGFFTEQGYVRVVKAIRKGVYEKAVAMLGEARAKHIVEEYIRVRKRRRSKLKHLLSDEEREKEKQRNKKKKAEIALINPAAAAARFDPEKENEIAVTQNSRVPEIEMSAVDVQITPINQGAVLEGENPPVVVVAQRLDEDDGEEDEVDEMKIMNFEDVECFEVVEGDDDDDEPANDDEAYESDEVNWMDEE